MRPDHDGKVLVFAEETFKLVYTGTLMEGETYTDTMLRLAACNILGQGKYICVCQDVLLTVLRRYRVAAPQQPSLVAIDETPRTFC